MRYAAKLVSVAALAATIVPSLLFMADSMRLPDAKLWMLVGTLAWFASAPLWMDQSNG